MAYGSRRKLRSGTLGGRIILSDGGPQPDGFDVCPGAQ